MNYELRTMKSLPDYVAVVRRRWPWFVIPAVVLLVSSIMVALMLPARYQSKAVILIEEQEVPADLVRSTISSFADQQVQVISQRVLTIDRTSAIVNKYSLYGAGSAAADGPSMERVERFRNNVHLELVSADVIDPRSGRPREATIAFTLGFSDADPKMARNVADELVSLFISENKTKRTEQATVATQFLAAEAESINAELLELEQKLATFKLENEGSLPQQYQFNLAALERAERDLSQLSLRREQLFKRRIELTAKMSQLNPTAPVVLPSGDVLMSDVDRLRALQAEYQKKAALYRETHPDVIRLKREMEALQSELGVGANIESLNMQLREQQQHLSNLRTKYSDDYHEIISTERMIGQIEEDIARARSQRDSTRSSAPATPDNPAYLVLQTELDTVESELGSLAAREQELRGKVENYQAMLKKAPQVEQEHTALLRDYENASEEYQRVKAKQRAAAVAQELESEQKGDRFAVVQPATIPDQPVSPNRPAIVFLGIVLSLGCGLAGLVLRELSDNAIHGMEELALVLGQEPLVAVPYINNNVDTRRRRQIAIAATGTAIISVLLVVYAATFVAG